MPDGRNGDRHRGRDRSRSPLSINRRESKASRRVYVANVPFDVKWNELKDLFRDKVGNVVYCQLFDNEDGKSRGCGLVEFSDSTAARKAIDVLHRYEYKGRELVVKEDLDCERDRFGRLILPNRRQESEDRGGRSPSRRGYGDGDHSYGTGVGTGNVGYSYNTYGLSAQFLESLGITGPLNNRIFVANLDYKVGEKKLEEIFRLAGKIVRVKLYTDSSGNSKGHGTVEYEHPVEAVQAISMFNNQKLYARPMSVRMDKYETEEQPEVLPDKLPSGLEGIGKGLGIGGQPLNISKSMLNAALNPTPTQAPLQTASLGAAQGVPAAGAPLTGPTSQPMTPMGGISGSINQYSSLPSMGSSTAAPLQNPTGYGGAPGQQGLSQNLDRAYSGLTSTLTGAAGSLSSSLANTAQNILNQFGSSLTGPSSHAPSSASTQPLPGSSSMASMYNSSYSPSYQTDGRSAPTGGPSGSLTDTIIVRGLPQNISWQNLRDRFGEIGPVRFAEMKARGTAVVRFVSERDAQRAVDLMNGIRIDNRPIEVTLQFY